MYDTYEEAQQKLANSVVIYDGAPVLVQKAGGQKNHVWLEFKRLPISRTSSEVEKRQIDDPRWDFRNLGSRLGYTTLQVPGSDLFETVYTSRIPTRHSRQGLDRQTVILEGMQVYQWKFENLIYQKGFNDMMTNTFMKPVEAFSTMVVNKGQYKSIAIGRKLALSYDQVTPPVLLYRTERIGYTEDGIKFKLADHKKHLREELEDIGGLRIA